MHLASRFYVLSYHSLDRKSIGLLVYCTHCPQWNVLAKTTNIEAVSVDKSVNSQSNVHWVQAAEWISNGTAEGGALVTYSSSIQVQNF